MMTRQVLLLLWTLMMVPCCHAFCIVMPQKSSRRDNALVFSATATSSALDFLTSTLKKPSKTLAVGIEYNPPVAASSSSSSSSNINDWTTLSMQLRQIKASVIVTSNVEAAMSFVKEQETAKGNFPGPCPVIYFGEQANEAIQKANVDAVIIDANHHDDDDLLESTSSSSTTSVMIHHVDNVEQVQALQDDVIILVDDDAVDSSSDHHLLSNDIISAAVSKSQVIIARVDSMQDDNAELERSKELKELGVHCIFFQNACVGDEEDVAYATFAVNGLTKKKSSTFNMSGLTGSTNGHFGGVATKTATTWQRNK